MPFRILIATDVFPPVCGGSGWSTYERFYPRLAAFLGDIAARERVDLVHAQHVLTGPASVRAARAGAVPSVCTVRDCWPVCYWGDLIHDFDGDDLCPRCSVPGMTRCLRARAVRTWPPAVPMIPYMQANLRMKRRDLSGADAVVAVSRRIAADLRSRAPELAGTRIEWNGCTASGSKLVGCEGMRRFLSYAYRSLKDVVTCLELVQRLYPTLPAKPIDVLIDEGNQISRMTHALMQRRTAPPDVSSA